MKRLFQILFFVFLIGIISAVADEYLETARLEETNDSVSSALPVIVITAENAVFELELYDNAAARRLIEQFPPKTGDDAPGRRRILRRFAGKNQCGRLADAARL